MLRPELPSYDIEEWTRQPFQTRLKMVCQSWAEQGYGTPAGIYLVYLAKVFAYVWGWSFFCSFSPGLGGFTTIHEWWLHPIAFQKAIIWSRLFEGLGLGCGSGPLTGRYVPPFGGSLYFLRPGTTKVPLFPSLPVLGGHTRSYLDVALCLAHYGFLVRALLAPTLSLEHILPTLVLLPLLGMVDKAQYLAARAEHYLIALLCWAFVGAGVPGCKWVWLAIWWGAATSKLNGHFPSVISVMISNSPVTKAKALRKLFYRDPPNDLRPSKLAAFMAHFGTLVEFAFPLVLFLHLHPTATLVALVVMLGFHLFITSSIPMGVPIEWNVMMVYGGVFLFWSQAGVSPFAALPLPLVGVLVISLLVVPIVGNFFPAYVSFLPSMRYYAGNWPWSVWLFRGDASDKLETCLVKTSASPRKQLRLLYDDLTITALLSKVMAFRAMHIQGRAIRELVPKAVDNIDEYEYIDGELIAGQVIGWNFGDGHLHDERLLAAIQAQCQFAPGDLRCVFVESQPMGRPTMSYRIVDAATGLQEKGTMSVKDMLEWHPWKEETSTNS
jgi:hypothetical protein